MKNISESFNKYSSMFLEKNQEAKSIYKIISDASFTDDEKEPVRNYSIGYFQTPMVLSLKYKSNGYQPNLRILAELGKLSTPISTQIDDSLIAINQIFNELNWQTAIKDINGILPIVFPKDALEVDKWNGGIWLGSESNANVLKLYMSLRHQIPFARWQKLADIFSIYGTVEIEPYIKAIMEITAPYGNPVGLCLGINKSGLKGIRFYVSSDNETFNTSQILCNLWFPEQTEYLSCFLNDFYNKFGNSENQSALFGFDFLISDDGTLISKPVRLKTELSCCHFDVQKQRSLEKFIVKAMDKQGIDGANFSKDIAHLKLFFFDTFYQYVSMGISEKDRHLSVYCEPYGKPVNKKNIYVNKEESLKNILNRSVAFLKTFRSQNGCFKDFDMTKLHGPKASDLWVEAFTALCLPESEYDLKIDSAKRILNFQNVDGGWGYNSGGFSDSDSTSQVILLLQQLKLDVPQNAYSFLLTHQCEDGGFSTYKRNDGWGKSHPDVTMTVVRALSAHSIPSSKVMQNVRRYLKNTFDENIVLPAYWWTSQHYTTLEAYKCCENTNYPFLINTETVLSRLPNLNSAFEQALYLELIHLLGRSDKAILKNLCSMQKSDGSFQAYPILRVTETQYSEPWKEQGFTGEIQSDIYQVFSTAAVVRMLSSCL